MQTIQKPPLSGLLALALVGASLLAGCQKQTTTTETPAGTKSTTTVSPTPTASQAVGQAADAAGDAVVTAKVKTAFLADTAVKGLQINVDTSNGVVTLTGALDNAPNVERAVTIAKGIDGVKSVVNRLTVKAP